MRGTFNPALEYKNEKTQADSISASTQISNGEAKEDMAEEVRPKTKKKRNKKSKKQQMN